MTNSLGPPFDYVFHEFPFFLPFAFFNFALYSRMYFAAFFKFRRR